MEGLLQRLHGAMPWLSVLGGIGHAPAWGERSLRGALFLGDRAYDSGAVGVLMSGPLQASSCMCAAVSTCLLQTRLPYLTTLASAWLSLKACKEDRRLTFPSRRSAVQISRQ